MIIYIILLIIIVFNFAISKRILIPVVIILILVSSLRSVTVGIDNISYKFLFQELLPNLSNRIALLRIEPGWLFINRVLYNINSSYQVIIVISSVLTIFPIYYVCKKASNYPSLSFLLYVTLFYYFISFSLIRQYIAISFTMLGAFYMNEKRTRLAITYLLLASFFHYSALITIPLIYLSNKLNFQIKYIAAILGISFIIGFGGFSTILKVLIEYIPFDKYSHYADYKSSLDINMINTYLFLIPQNIICYLTLKFSKKSSYSYLLLFGVILLNLFSTIPLFSRLAMFFTIYEIIIIPNLIIESQRKINKQLYILLVLGYLSSYVVYFLLSNRAGVIPYKIY